mmetsp:Transcript_23429/g.42046  ORF Transcript_23429/g.42046 Transcript_23429/m.42046 type:complete len:269 (-) Transcript_23429:370-1176(-)
MMHDVSIHHVMTHAIDPRSVIPVHRLERASLEGERVVGVHLPVLGVMLEVGDHVQPERHDEPRDHAHHGEVGRSHGRPQRAGGGERNGNGYGGIGLLLERMSLPHPPREKDVIAIRNTHGKVHKVEEWEVEHPHVVRCLDRGMIPLGLLANTPLMRIILLDVIVAQVMLPMTQRPRNERRQAHHRVSDLSHHAIDRLAVLRVLAHDAVTRIVADAPRAPHGESGQHLQRHHRQGLLVDRPGVVRVARNDGVEESHGGYYREHIDGEVE